MKALTWRDALRAAATDAATRGGNSRRAVGPDVEFQRGAQYAFDVLADEFAWQARGGVEPAARIRELLAQADIADAHEALGRGMRHLCQGGAGRCVLCNARGRHTGHSPYDAVTSQDKWCCEACGVCWRGR